MDADLIPTKTVVIDPRVEYARAFEIGSRLRVLRDRVIVKRFDYQHPFLAVVGVVLQKGVVVAAGYGRRVRRKVKFEQGNLGRAIWFEDGDETGKILPMKLKVGDVVEFSPRNQFEFRLEGEDLISVWQNACYCKTDASKSNALLWQQSAGHDRHGNFMSGKEMTV
jgi:hypothetical protein